MSFERFRPRQKPVATDTDTWFGGGMVFTVDTYLGSVLAPTELVTSVRCVLRCGTQIMLMEDAERRQHVLPGGQIELGESHREALEREIREETGCTLASVEQLGACVFTHTTPRPTGYRYPYPTFVHWVYRGEADERNSEASERDEHVVACRFVNREELDTVPLTSGERALVAASYCKT